jgi:hypothetical protein
MTLMAGRIGPAGQQDTAGGAHEGCFVALQGVQSATLLRQYTS